MAINNIIQYFKKYKRLFIYLTAYLLLFGLIYYFFISHSFVIINDDIYQYEIFYNEWVKIVTNFLKTFKFNTYSFNMFLGTDFYSSMGGLCIGDIFLPILLLFRHNIHIGLIIEIVLCVYISTITMSIFLDNKGIKNTNIIIYISLIYALGGQAILYVQNYMFHRFFAFLPLLFLSFNIYLKNKKRIPFILSTFLLFTQSYYFMYMTVIFLFFYAIVECVSQHFDLKTIIHFFFDLLFCLIIGFLLSSFITLPAMMSIISNVSVREQTSSFIFWGINSQIGQLLSLISLNPQMAIPSIFTMGYDYHGSWFNLFVTIVPIAYIFGNIFNKESKIRNYFLIGLFIVALVKPLNSIMHGFSIPSLRWIFLIEFYILYLAAIYMDNDLNKKKVRNTFWIVTAISALLVLILYILGYIYSYNKIHLIYLIISIIVCFLLSISFVYNKNISMILSIVFIFCSTVFYFNLSAFQYNYIELISKDEIEYQENYLDPFHRYYYSYMNTFDGIPLDANGSLLYNIMSTSTYSSSFDPNINKFLSLNDNNLASSWNIEISDPNLLTMLGVKYYIVGDRIKDQYSNNIDLEYAYSLSSKGIFDVYSNKNYRGFGYCANNVDYLDNYDGNTNNFTDTVYIDNKNEDITNYISSTYASLNIKEMQNNILKADITLDNDNVLLIPFPNNKGWKIKVNDNNVYPISVNGGFIGLKLNKGYNNIVMEFHTPYLMIGSIISVFGLIITIIIARKERKS